MLSPKPSSWSRPPSTVPSFTFPVSKGSKCSAQTHQNENAPSTIYNPSSLSLQETVSRKYPNGILTCRLLISPLNLPLELLRQLPAGSTQDADCLSGHTILNLFNFANPRLFVLRTFLASFDSWAISMDNWDSMATAVVDLGVSTHIVELCWLKKLFDDEFGVRLVDVVAVYLGV